MINFMTHMHSLINRKVGGSIVFVKIRLKTVFFCKKLPTFCSFLHNSKSTSGCDAYLLSVFRFLQLSFHISSVQIDRLVSCLGRLKDQILIQTFECLCFCLPESYIVESNKNRGVLLIFNVMILTVKLHYNVQSNSLNRIAI